MTQSRRDHREEDADPKEWTENVEPAPPEPTLEVALPVPPLRWVYSPGEVRLQWAIDNGDGSFRWETVPNVKLEDAQGQ